MSEEEVIKKRARGYARIRYIQEVEKDIEEDSIFSNECALLEEYCINKELELITIHKDYEEDYVDRRYIYQSDDECHYGVRELLSNIQKGEYIIVFDLLSLTLSEYVKIIDVIKKKKARFICLSHKPCKDVSKTEHNYFIYVVSNEHDKYIEESKCKRRHQ